ncbi:hypothetical protein SKAU_G00223930 [Synaphobranchus kaupii]|uniref:Uncharacterized protein n=1 Tax=Synaphobranchus kaupii TaxID=118154 RepID=A0A9Q1IW51_SYNKA|nr:hypothetical protein SKAU_G00223930 [Synaphobranchus kaupii]
MLPMKVFNTIYLPGRLFSSLSDLCIRLCLGRLWRQTCVFPAQSKRDKRGRGRMAGGLRSYQLGRGARTFMSAPAVRLLKYLGVGGAKLRRARKKLAERSGEGKFLAKAEEERSDLGQNC